MTDAERADEIRRACEAWSPPRARDLLPSPGVGRGGRREGAGRKPVGEPGADGRTPRTHVTLDAEARAGAQRYADELGSLGGGVSEALRELALAFGQDARVHEAVVRWKREHDAAKAARAQAGEGR